MNLKNTFIKTQMLIGEANLQKLRESHVTIVGLGAVGSYALEALVRAGIGNIRIVDFDKIKPSNFNRQLLALHSTLDMYKTEAAYKRIMEINPECNVEIFNEFIDKDSFNKVFKVPTDIVIDAIDGVSTKTLLLAGLVMNKIPVISCMGAALKLNPLAIKIADISQTNVCHLAKRIRKNLKKLGIITGITCIYSEEVPKENLIDIEDNENTYKQGRDRKPIGSISYVPGIFGLLAASEVIKFILKTS